MPWGRLDDGFDDHDKVLALLCDEGIDGAAAVGLWTLCFSWAHRNTRKRGRLPGRLPRTLPFTKLGPDGMRLARLLVAHGLWDEVPAAEGGGWQIHNFHRHLPDEATRAARAEAGRKGALARWSRERAERAAREASEGHGNQPSPDGTLLSEGGSQPSGDGKRHGLPDGKTGVPSELSVSQSSADGSLPSADGSLLHLDPVAGPPRTDVEHDAQGVDQRVSGDVVSMDGALPLGYGNLPSSGSKTAPLSLSLSPIKDLSPTEVGGQTSPPAPTPIHAGRRDDYTREFEEFWAAYGKKGSKKRAAVEWHRAVRRAPREVIMAAVDPYLASRPDPQYRKDAERWLKGDCWEATPVQHTATGTGSRRPAPLLFRNPPSSSVYDTSGGM